MQKIGKDGEIRESHYREWPLFQWFRETDWFKSAFQAVYGIKFTVTESLGDSKASSLVQQDEYSEMDGESDCAPEAEEPTSPGEVISLAPYLAGSEPEISPRLASAERSGPYRGALAAGLSAAGSVRADARAARMMEGELGN